MLRIYCPYCESVRDEDEFHCVGEAHIKDPNDLTSSVIGRGVNTFISGRIQEGNIAKSGITRLVVGNISISCETQKLTKSSTFTEWASHHLMRRLWTSESTETS